MESADSREYWGSIDEVTVLWFGVGAPPGNTEPGDKTFFFFNFRCPCLRCRARDCCWLADRIVVCWLFPLEETV